MHVPFLLDSHRPQRIPFMNKSWKDNLICKIFEFSKIIKMRIQTVSPPSRPSSEHIAENSAAEINPSPSASYC